MLSTCYDYECSSSYDYELHEITAAMQTPSAMHILECLLSVRYLELFCHSSRNIAMHRPIDCNAAWYHKFPYSDVFPSPCVQPPLQ